MAAVVQIQLGLHRSHTLCSLSTVSGPLYQELSTVTSMRTSLHYYCYVRVGFPHLPKCPTSDHPYLQPRGGTQALAKMGSSVQPEVNRRLTTLTIKCEGSTMNIFPEKFLMERPPNSRCFVTHLYPPLMLAVHIYDNAQEQI